MISSNHLSEFSSPNRNDWTKRFQSELKTGNENLGYWNIQEGLFSEPYQSNIKINPIQLEFNQNSQKAIGGCINVVEFTFNNNYDIYHTISSYNAKGITGFWCNINSLEEIDLLADISFQNKYIFAKIKNKDLEILYKLISSPNFKLGGIGNDPIANWMQYGIDYRDSLDIIIAHLQKNQTIEKFSAIMVNATTFHEAGANIILEIALTISAVVNYLDLLTDKGISAVDALNSIFYSIAVGPSYITEIAKLRALRILIKQVGLMYEIPFSDIIPFIHVTNSRLYNSSIEENNNILRNTTEAMSAIIGGCDALKIVSHTSDKTNLHADRLAQNCLNILQNEAYFDKVADPIAGAYSIEQLTENIRLAAWELFLEIESKGGIMAYHKSGELKKALDKSWLEKQYLFDKNVMIGVNKYRNDPIPSIEKKQSATLFYSKKNLADHFIETNQH